MSAPKCSLIIRCFNEEQHIGRLLAGVMQQVEKDVEIVVVDSGSTDSTVAIAERFPIKLVSIKPQDFTFGRALNIGCQAATGEILCMASAHVYPLYNDWLSRMLAAFEDSSVGIVYGKQRGDERNKYSECQIFNKWFPETGRDKQDHPFCNNANTAVRRSLWEQLRYDEALTGLEDLEFAKRAMALGHHLVYEPEATVIHVHEESFRRVYHRYFREALALRQIMPAERFGILDFLRLYPSNVIADLYHAFHDRLLTRKAIEILLFRTMQLWGTYRGWNRRGAISEALRQTFYYPNRLERTRTPAEQACDKRAIDYSGVLQEKNVRG